MNKKEVVVCAAVRFYRDEDDEIGVVVMGLNQADCEDTYVALFDNGWEECNTGFKTNIGRFVSGYEALEITGRQNEMRFQNRKYLLPEDLY